jgi:hypothetical protein
MVNKIYCPRCGKHTTSETSFCRDCGLALDGVATIVNADAANISGTTTKPNYKMIRVGIALFILGTVLGLANIIVRDLDLFPEIYGKAIFLSFVIAGLLSMGLSFLFPKKVYKKRERTGVAADVANALNTGPLDAQLPPAKIIDADISFPKASREHVAAEPASVTESTTRRLG